MKRIKKRIHLLILGCCLFLLFGCRISARAEENEAKTGKYVIYVNRAANCVTVSELDLLGNEVPVRAMACSCGRAGHATPLGTYETSSYAEWCLMVDGTYGRYAVRFNKMIWFHSVPYLEKTQDSLEWDQFNLLGERASLGCVRLCVADMKWIFDNCKAGTRVVVYDDAENPGPLGKPEPVRIDENSPYRGWDPTDPDPNSPWNLVFPNGVTYENFDAERYAELYPDVKAVFGTDKAGLWTHYTEYGLKEGRSAFPVGNDEADESDEEFKAFDAESYAELYPDVVAVFGTEKELLWLHYTMCGKAEGRTAVFVGQ